MTVFVFVVAVVCLCSLVLADEGVVPHVKWAQRRSKVLLTIVENNIEQGECGWHAQSVIDRPTDRRRCVQRSST
jgi:hypothetical protein